MSLNLDKGTWKRVRLGDVISRSRVQTDPVSSGVERYVAGGHVDSDGMTINRWGHVGDGQMGSTFRYVFKPGQVLFVSARPYLRKVGVPDFGGVVADKTYVLDALLENGLLQEFLPFVLSSEKFVEYATAEATGSMNPRLLWGPMQRYEFDLPPLDEQKRLADLLWAVERHRLSLAAKRGTVTSFIDRWLSEKFYAMDDDRRPLSEAVASSAYGPRFSNSLYSDAAEYRLLRTTDMDLLGNIDYSTMPYAALDNTFDPHLLQHRDFLISRSGTCGVPAVFDATQGGEKTIPGAFLIRLRLNEQLDPYFLRAFFNSSPGRKLAASLSQGGVQKNIRGSSLLEARVPIPFQEKQQDILEQLSSLERAASVIDRESNSLVALMTSLSQNIFGGAA